MRRGTRLLGTVLGLALAIGAVGALVQFVPDRGLGSSEPPVATASRADDAHAEFEAAFAHGVAFLEQRKAPEAARALKQAVELRPEVPEAHVNLGFALLDLGSTNEAVSAFERALDLRANQPNAYFGLAEALEKKGDLPGALGAMRSFVHLTNESDGFRPKAMAAIWEWETRLGREADAGSSVTPSAQQSTSASSPAFTVAVPTIPTLEDLGGANALLDGLKGKIVVLNFWATWCPPCRAELPSLQALAEGTTPERVIVLGISIDKDADYVREYLRERGVHYRNVLDPDRALAGRFNVTSYPQTLLIDAEGEVRERVYGARDWQAEGPKLIERMMAATQQAQAR